MAAQNGFPLKKNHSSQGALQLHQLHWLHQETRRRITQTGIPASNIQNENTSETGQQQEQQPTWTGPMWTPTTYLYHRPSFPQKKRLGYYEKDIMSREQQPPDIRLQLTYFQIQLQHLRPKTRPSRHLHLLDLPTLWDPIQGIRHLPNHLKLPRLRVNQLLQGLHLPYQQQRMPHRIWRTPATLSIVGPSTRTTLAGQSSRNLWCGSLTTKIFNLFPLSRQKIKG